MKDMDKLTCPLCGAVLHEMKKKECKHREDCLKYVAMTLDNSAMDCQTCPLNPNPGEVA